VNRDAESRTAAAGPPLYGVDTMLFVYHFENNEQFGEPAGELLAAAEQGQCRLVASVLSLLEVLVIPKRHGMEELCRRYREMFSSFPNLSVRPIDDQVAEIAADLPLYELGELSFVALGFVALTSPRPGPPVGSPGSATEPGSLLGGGQRLSDFQAEEVVGHGTILPRPQRAAANSY
jgi:hypothetical protein